MRSLLVTSCVVALASPAVADGKKAAPKPVAVKDACAALPLQQWKATAPSPLADRMGVNVRIHSDGQQFLVVEQSPPHDAALYDPCSDRWTKLDHKAALAWLRTHRLVDEVDRGDGIWVGTHRVMWPTQPSTSMAQFDRATVVDAAGRVRKVRAAGAPSPRYATGGVPGNHLELPVGDSLFVWGGSSTSGRLGDGAILDVKAARWRRVASKGAPSPRDRPLGVWTGREVIVWGGLGDVIMTHKNGPPDGRVGFTDGARYDPVKNRWSPMSDHDAPRAMSEPLVAWSGRHLVVLGGSPTEQSTVFTIGAANIPVTDGGLYDPSTDRWRPLPAPAGFVSIARKALAGPRGIAVVGSGGLAVLDEHAATWTVLPGKGAFGGFTGWSGTTLLVYRGFDPGPPGPNGCEGATRPCDPVSRSRWLTQIQVIRLF